MKVEQISKRAQKSGIETGGVVRVVSSDALGDNAVTVACETDDGRLGKRVLSRSNQHELEGARAGRLWRFGANGEAFKLAAEAIRINLAHLFDPVMAVNTANVEPLTHKITSVDVSMLPRQPLRFVLPDDPRAG